MTRTNDLLAQQRILFHRADPRPPREDLLVLAPACTSIYRKCMQIRLASPHRLNWRRALLRLWLLFSLGWITVVIAWITWDAFAEYQRFDADRTMQAWEVEFRSIEGMSHGEWCGKTASDRARMAKEECGDRFLRFPFSREDCMFIWSKCPRPLLSLPPEGWERFTATAGSIGAYLFEHGPAHVLRLGIIGFLPPLVLLAFAVFLVAPLARWVLAGLRD